MNLSDVITHIRVFNVATPKLTGATRLRESSHITSASEGGFQILTGGGRGFMVC